MALMAMKTLIKTEYNENNNFSFSRWEIFLSIQGNGSMAVKSFTHLSAKVALKN